MLFRPILLCAALLVQAAVVRAQKPGSVGGSPGASGTNSGTIPGLTVPTANTPDVSNSAQSYILISGRVQMDDGGPTPSDVVIQKVCGSRTEPLGYPDRKGHFSLALNRNATANFSDASYDANTTVSIGPTDGSAPVRRISRSSFSGCQVRAASANYHSDSIHIGSERSLDSNDIGTIVLHRNGGMQGGSMISATMLNAPKAALKAYDHGVDALRKGNPAAAGKEFRKAVEAHPQFATAWYQLGLLAMPVDLEEAEADFNRSLAADPKFLRPYGDEAALLAHQQKWAEMLSLTERGLKLDSSFPQLYYYNALANMQLGHIDEAEKRVREAIKLDSAHTVPMTSQLLGYILARRGDWRGATEQMRAYLAASPNGPDAQLIQTQIAELEAKMRK